MGITNIGFNQPILPMKKIAIVFGLMWMAISASAQSTYKVVLHLPMQFELMKGDTVSQKSIPALNFYLGFKMAMDSLASKGLNAELEVKDHKNDSATLAAIPEKAGADLEVVFGKDGKITFYTGNKQGNEMVSLNSGMNDHLKALANFGVNELISVEWLSLSRGRPEEKKVFSAFMNHMRPMGIDTIPSIVRTDFTAYPIEKYLKKGAINVVFIPSADQSFVANAMNRLQTLSDKYTIIVFGLSNWLTFSAIETELFADLQVTLSSEKFIEYNRSDVVAFRKRFQAKNYTEPQESAFKGFDAGFFWGMLMLKYGDNFSEHITDQDLSRLVNAYRFVKKADGTYLNTAVQIIQCTDYGFTRQGRQ